MMYLGEEGYLDIVRSIMEMADKLIEGVRSVPELILIGEPTFVVSFRSEEVDVYHVNDFMKTRGWRFNVLQLPPALHFCVTLPQTKVDGIAETFTVDLKEGVEYARSKEGEPSASSALYGIAGSVEGNQTVTNMTYGFFDHLFSV
jgi:glutamate/tyrosine decarboxylase-like PLP-dependent enzyme